MNELEALIRSTNLDDVKLALILLTEKGVEETRIFRQMLIDKYGSDYLNLKEVRLDIYVNNINIVLYEDSFYVYLGHAEPLMDAETLYL